MSEGEVLAAIDEIADALEVLVEDVAKRLGLDESEVLDRVTTEAKARLL